MNVNKAIILGNVTRDPIIRALPSGRNVASFGVATNRYWTDKQTNEKKSQVEYHNVSAFGRLAEIAQQYLKKGGLVYVEGRLQTNSWTDKQGNTRYKTDIIAERMQLGPRQAGQSKQTGNTPSQNTKTPPPVEEEINVDEIPF